MPPNNQAHLPGRQKGRIYLLGVSRIIRCVPFVSRQDKLDASPLIAFDCLSPTPVFGIGYLECPLFRAVLYGSLFKNGLLLLTTEFQDSVFLVLKTESLSAERVEDIDRT